MALVIAGYRYGEGGYYDETDGSGPYSIDSQGRFSLLTNPQCFTDLNGPNSRYRVDPGQTGLFARRMWRVSHEFTALAADPQVFKVLMPCNFMIHHQDLECDQGGIVMRAYRSTQGSEGGTFVTPIPYYSANFMDEEPAYTFLANLTTGGTFTPSEGQTSVETIRARSATATAQQQSVGGASFGERGLSAGTFYLVFARMTGVSGDCKGVYNLVIEERPNGSALP